MVKTFSTWIFGLEILDALLQVPFNLNFFRSVEAILSYHLQSGRNFQNFLVAVTVSYFLVILHIFSYTGKLQACTGKKHFKLF